MADLKELTERLEKNAKEFEATMKTAETASKRIFDSIETIIELLKEAMPPIIAHYGERILSRKENQEYSEK